ncbi:MAG: hypothetical protein RIS35_2291 [Pseudomonadota bacterium]|jgi:hypothetical protein
MTRPSPLDALIDEAFTYAFPVWEIARTRHVDLTNPDPTLRIEANTAWHDRRLCDHHARWITTPNNDTLYSRAWLDLSRGPVKVTVDAMPPERYWSVAFLDAYSNNFAMIGTRLDGAGPVSLTITGPGHAGPMPAGRVLRAPGNDVWLFARWIVDGPDDLPNAHAMQERLRVEPAGVARPAHAVPTDVASPGNFLAVVNEQLARNPPPAADAPLLARCAAVGLQPGNEEVWTALPQPVRDAWNERIVAALNEVRRAIPRLAIDVQGWKVRGPEIGNFGTAYESRAAIALGGLAALEPIEAVYASRALDEGGRRFDGRRGHRLRIAPEGLPTDSFWSLSLYESMPDGRLFFADNPIGRYTIGDRTPGLRHAPDGALEILLQHAEPADPADRANWLPAPPGPFVITLRAYLPRPELREWRVALPTILTKDTEGVP